MPRERSDDRGLTEGRLMVTDWGVVARAVHILAVVVWIGGVWFVTAVLLPAMKGKPAQQWMQEFDAFEHRFAPQARVAVLLVLLSGVYMLYRYDLWGRFADGGYWWMHLMVAVWLLFAALLFIVEPLAADRLVRRRAVTAPEATLTFMLWLHRVMLALALLAVFAAVGGSHGLF
jgi:uncharacterized membrane protein